MSLENYIIICDGRIDMQTSHNQMQRMRATSRCATEFVKFNRGKLTKEDAQAISDLQHEMMDVANGKKLAGTHDTKMRSVDELIDEMFAQLELLEKKMSY